MHRALEALSSAFASLPRLLGRSKQNPLRGKIKRRAKVTLGGAFPCPKGSTSKALGRILEILGQWGQHPPEGWRCPVPAAPPQPLAAFPWSSWWQQPPCPSSLPSAGTRHRGDGRTGCPRGTGTSLACCVCSRQMQTPGALLWLSDHSNSHASPPPAHQRCPSRGEPPADRTELCFPHGAERSELCCRGARKTREIKRMNRYGLIVCL